MRKPQTRWKSSKEAGNSRKASCLVDGFASRPCGLNSYRNTLMAQPPGLHQALGGEVAAGRCAQAEGFFRQRTSSKHVCSKTGGKKLHAVSAGEVAWQDCGSFFNVRCRLVRAFVVAPTFDDWRRSDKRIFQASKVAFARIPPARRIGLWTQKWG